MNLPEFKDELEKYINYAKCRLDKSLCGTLTWNVLSALKSFSAYLEENPFPDAESVVLTSRKINDYTLENDIVLTKEDVDLGKVENFAPNELPVSDATQEALDLKTDKSTFNTQIALKANTTDVNSALSTKANTSDVVGKTFTINGKPLSSPFSLGINDVISAGTTTQFLRGDRTWSTVSYNDLTNRPTLFSGNYNDLSNKPNLFSGAYSDLTGKPILFSGDYNDLSNKPSTYTLPNKLQNFNDYSYLEGTPSAELQNKNLLLFNAKAFIFGAEGVNVSQVGDFMFTIIENSTADGSKLITFNPNYGKSFQFSGLSYFNNINTSLLETSIIQTTGALPIYNSTLNQYVLYIAESGNVGIGYNLDRGYKLDVNGTAAFLAMEVAGNATLKGTTRYDGNIIVGTGNTYDLGTGAVRFRHGYFNQNLYTGALYSGVLRSANASNGLSVANANGTRQMHFLDNGNVIVGNSATDTGYRLTVLGTTQLNGDVVPDTTATYNIGSASLRYNQLYIADRIVSSQVYAQIFRSGNSSGFTFYNVGANRVLSILDNGNTVLGTTTTDNGYKLTVEGNTVIGGSLVATRLQINSANLALASSSYFSAFIPSVNLELPNVATDPLASNENAMVVRGRFNGNDTLPKRISYLLKLSSEGTESKKMGGMMLESLNTYGNSPNLFFLTDNEKRIQVMSGGNTRFYGGQYTAGNALVYTELTSNDLQFMRSDGASYVTQLNNQPLVMRVMNGASTTNQFTLFQSGTAQFTGNVQFPSWRTSSATVGSNIRNSTNTTTLVTFFDNGNVRLASDSADTGYKLQVVGETRMYGTLLLMDNGEAGYINLGGIIIGKAPFQQTRLYGALEIKESLVVGTQFPNNVNLTPSAILEVTGTTGGFLLPRMLATNMNAIGTPATGLMVYQTDGSAGIYYRSATAWEQLVSATALNAIKQAVPATKTTSTTNTLTAADYGGNKNLFIRVDASAGAVTITLPASSTIAGFTTKIIKVDSSANAVTIKGNGSELINGANTRLLTDQYQSVILENDGTKSHVF